MKENKKITNERGSITLYILLTFLFFMVVTTGVYINIKNRENAQEEEIGKIKNKYAQVKIEKKSIVTFDANGGNVDIDSKEVKVGENYGTLPIPVREGYTFLGWNGKNLFDSSKLLEANGWKEENGVYSGDIRYLYNKWSTGGGGEPIYTNFKPNTVYTLSFETKNETTNGGVKFSFSYEGEGVASSNSPVTSNSTDFRNYKVISKNGETVKNLSISYNSRQTVWLRNIQLEENSNETEYEPYYVTESTKVTQRKNHTLKAIWEEKNKSNLPSTYQQVEYIQSAGTQYIDTGMKGTQDTRAVIDFQYVEGFTSGRIFGSRDNTASKGGNKAFWLSLYNATSGGWYFQIGDKGYTGPGYDMNRHTMDFGKSIYIDGTLKQQLEPSNDFTTPTNLYLFGSHNEADGTLNTTKAKIYSCKIYDGSTLVRNFIPCVRKSDSVIGMYDLVTNIFYTNAGTGTFSKGNDVT